MKKTVSVILALLLSWMAAASASVYTSLFVATDRHARYETVKPPEAQADGPQKDKKRPREIPFFDGEGKLVFHDKLADLLALVRDDPEAVQPSIVLLGGDNAGQGSDQTIDATGYPAGAPYFSFSEINEEISSVLGKDVKTIYTYGSHDRNMTDLYHNVAFSGPLCADGYCIYGITFAQMIYATDEMAAEYTGRDLGDPYGVSAQSASLRFLEWARSLEGHQPMIVMSHVPLHAHRGDNAGAMVWANALNQVALDHDILFLYGHNHTLERNEEDREIEQRNYLQLPGSRLTVQDGKDDTQDIEIRFAYMNAGYITEGFGSLLTWTDTDEDKTWDSLTATRYSLSDVAPVMFGSTGILSPWTWNLRQWKEE